MKRFLTLFLFFTGSMAVIGQNLIPDPSVENVVECPSTLGNIEVYTNSWLNFRGSPDYRHSCGESSSLGWNNGVGYQVPRTGLGYLGLFTFHQGLSDARESFGVQLENPLQVGETYHLSFYVSTAYRPIAFNMTSNNIGCLFMVDNYLDPAEQGMLPNQATFSLDEIITDTVNWVNVSHTFVCDSAYQYLCFGNFFEDSLTDTLRLEGDLSNALSYYYFDDFCLSTNPNECDLISLTDNKLGKRAKIYPNPTAGNIFIQSQSRIFKLEIYDLAGEVLATKNINGLTKVEVPINLSGGMYLLQISTENGLSQKRFMVQ
jgi:hypothetical protein